MEACSRTTLCSVFTRKHGFCVLTFYDWSNCAADVPVTRARRTRTQDAPLFWAWKIGTSFNWKSTEKLTLNKMSPNFDVIGWKVRSTYARVFRWSVKCVLPMRGYFGDLYLIVCLPCISALRSKFTSFMPEVFFSCLFHGISECTSRLQVQFSSGKTLQSAKRKVQGISTFNENVRFSCNSIFLCVSKPWIKEFFFLWSKSPCVESRWKFEIIYSCKRSHCEATISTKVTTPILLVNGTCVAGKRQRHHNVKSCQAGYNEKS